MVSTLMATDRDTLIALLREVSRQSEPFQSLIHDYALDAMGDPEVHYLFTTRLNNDMSMLRRISNLKTSSSRAAPSQMAFRRS